MEGHAPRDYDGQTTLRSPVDRIAPGASGEIKCAELAA
jgi:hypothetical protein